MGFGADARRLAEAAQYPGETLARVVSQYKEKYRIVTERGERMAEVSGKYRYAASAPEDYPAVGDFVMASGGEAGDAIITRTLARRSVFFRTGVGNVHERQVIAANVDVLFACMSANSNYNLNRLERYLSVAWDSGATPVAVLTKADLAEDLPGMLRALKRIAPGTDVLFTASGDPASIEALSAHLTPGVTGALIGSSGVGKSTLINCLTSGAPLETAEVRADGKGRHTTTRRELVPLPGGGMLIDTPGMRELGAEAVDLSRSFSDIDALAAQCRFADCAHKNEPGCAVRRAIAEGALDERRLSSYLRLKREAKYDGLSARAIEQEKGAEMFAAIGGMKKRRRYVRENDKRNG